LSLESPLELLSIVDSIVCKREELTLFCLEGSVIYGPNGTGMYDSIHGKPKRDLIAALCQEAEYVLAMGTCAAFGGIPAAPPNPSGSSGLQVSLDKPGGLLSPEWRSRAGFPVFNLSGCPVDAVTMLKTMSLIINGAPPALDTLNRPMTVRPCLSEESPGSVAQPRRWVIAATTVLAPHFRSASGYSATAELVHRELALERKKKKPWLRNRVKRGEGGYPLSRRLIQLDMNRVEGDFQIKLQVEPNTVTDAWCVGSMYRGYEEILVGREPSDALVIAPRICGICSTSQLYAATLALEHAS
jgi:hypothetical protein